MTDEHDSHGGPALELARRPTPLEPLPRLSASLGVEVWVKRDDLTGFGLSGNKIRKLELLAAEAVRRGATQLVTCGGLQSNHCRATATVARRTPSCPTPSSAVASGAVGGDTWSKKPPCSS